MLKRKHCSLIVLCRIGITTEFVIIRTEFRRAKTKEKKKEKIKEVLLKSATILLHDAGTDRIFYDRQEGDCRRGCVPLDRKSSPVGGIPPGRERAWRSFSDFYIAARWQITRARAPWFVQRPGKSERERPLGPRRSAIHACGWKVDSQTEEERQVLFFGQPNVRVTIKCWSSIIVLWPADHKFKGPFNVGILFFSRVSLLTARVPELACPWLGSSIMTRFVSLLISSDFLPSRKKSTVKSRESSSISRSACSREDSSRREYESVLAIVEEMKEAVE